jgi:hypothetical protein
MTGARSLQNEFVMIGIRNGHEQARLLGFSLAVYE